MNGGNSFEHQNLNITNIILFSYILLARILEKLGYKGEKKHV